MASAVKVPTGILKPSFAPLNTHTCSHDQTRSPFLFLVSGAGCVLATGDDEGQSQLAQERTEKLLA